MRGREDMPLLAANRGTSLDSTTIITTTTTGGQQQQQGVTNDGFELDLQDVEDQGREYWEDDFDEDKVMFADNKTRGTKLIWNDFLIVTLEYLQWLALIQSMALRWPWPQDWLLYTTWILAFNADAWDMTKIYHNGTYKSIQNYDTDTSLMPFMYYQFSSVWGGVLLALLAVFIIVYVSLSKRSHPFVMVQIATLQRVFVIILQVIAIPVGVALGKMFFCSPDAVLNVGKVMAVDNTQPCFGDTHWSYASIALGISAAMYIPFPVWLILNTKRELIFDHASGHEAHLQLKETEYVRGLDVVYIVSGFHVFSSFRLRAAHYRAIMHIFKFICLCMYAGLYEYTNYQAIVLAGLFFVAFITLCILRPFRVASFNALLIVNFLCLTFNLLTGAIRTSFDTYSIRSVWFTPSYMRNLIVIINCTWLLVTICIMIYLLLHNFGCMKRNLWPSLNSQGVEKLDDQTKKFMKGVIRARHVVEQSMSLPPLFAPAHELSRQVQIINAYCREAELLDNPLQDTLWHLLDELIEVHSQISPKSLFSESVKESIRSTAAELMTVMPMFVKRLAQREYDFILVPPVKRRILLKMYCMGMFLNGRTRRKNFNQLNEEALGEVWSKEMLKKRKKVDYLAEIQPESQIGPRVGKVHQSDAMMMEELEDDDTLSILSDNASADLSAMMQGIPSRPSTELSIRPISQGRSGSTHSQNRPGSSSSQHRPGSASSQQRPGSSQSGRGATSRAGTPLQIVREKMKGEVLARQALQNVGLSSTREGSSVHASQSSLKENIAESPKQSASTSSHQEPPTTEQNIPHNDQAVNAETGEPTGNTLDV